MVGVLRGSEANEEDHSHVHVLDGVHDVHPQHEVGDEAKENKDRHMNTSPACPMRHLLQ